MKPVPLDANGHPLLSRGSELFTYRFQGLGSAFTDVTLPIDIKQALIHVEAGNEVLHVLGSVPGSTEARWTDAGSALSFPVAMEAGSIICTLAIPTGTKNVSVFAWR
jgi:hypothetical protein